MNKSISAVLRTRATVLLTAGGVTLLGIPAVAAAESPANLYVNNRPDAHCTDTGAGSPAAPFCTIQAAVKAVAPGQTVRINPETNYDEPVTIDRSGEPGKPITFAVDARGDSRALLRSDEGLTITGASHVVLRGLTLFGGAKINRSSDVVVEQSEIHGSTKGLRVGDGSTDVRISRSRVTSPRIEGGSRGTVLSRNLIVGGTDKPAVVADAPGTAFTNNHFAGGCGTSLSVSGSSTGSSVFNNVFLTAESDSSACAADKTRTPLVVAQSATSGTRADYNLLAGSPKIATVPYTWAGTAYKDAAAFAAATGQGGHDIITPNRDRVGVMDGSLTIDSGDPTAPGALLTGDMDGNPVADDPRVPNTGKNGGYVDRGAYETAEHLTDAFLSIDQAWAPIGTKVTAYPGSDSRWPSGLTYTTDFGDGTPPIVTRPGDATDGAATHVYTSPCSCAVTVIVANALGTKLSASWPVKVTPAGPLNTVFTAKPVVPVPDDEMWPVAPLTFELDTKATAAPWPIQNVDVDYGDNTSDSFHALDAFRHTYKTPGDYKVTVTILDIKGGTSTSTRTVKAAYAPSGYVATEPFRLMDTRTTSSAVSGPVTVTLPVGRAVPGHPLSSSMAAAVVNVTVTGATEDTHLTVWPQGQPRPATSNVNVLAGGTSSNTVTVPVGSNGKLYAQLNSGRASLIVDFVGYYQPETGQRFSPLAPTRVLDTRTMGVPLSGAKTRTVKVAGVNGIPADATAVALNLTGTGAKEQAHVIAYPDPAKRPATSNLNVEPGKDKSNQVIVPVGPNGTITLFTNTGSTHVILDAVGYYGKDGKALFTPVVPKRLADTRTTGKVAPGATTTVSGLPANALGAVLNITATDTTAPGFLTAYAFGGTLPGASSLNTLPGRTVPNHVTTPVANGKVSIFNSYGGPNHVITDLLGYFTAN
ncbi:PKD domain-containing protein [Streptomyces sp. G1]|uniref:PKD domain-containing protein n=1 Tax=Streptomyces sp. G1 TaxID=361572 RepID=UPI00202E10AF|nr:PKD domain-containing protein [Streptomyces sp. G1]MCM1965431.1 right-handed parallel beta-helix repeat-containing protein [Streptomyces sp. G1]